MIRRRPSTDARRLTDTPTPLGCPLNDRELRTLTAVAEGQTSPEIAADCGSPVSTIRAQVWSAGKKLHTTNRAASVLACTRHGWIKTTHDDAPSPVVVLLAAVDKTLTTLYDRLISGVDFRCTPAQSDYLRAFERMLRTPHDGHGDQAIVDAQAEMGRKLETVMGEAKIETVRGQNAASYQRPQLRAALTA